VPIEDDEPVFLPPAPPGGGILVLTPTQMANERLIAAIRKYYPETKIVMSQKLPTE
jgi:hypothetical protein